MAVFLGICLGGALGAMLRGWLTHLGPRRAPWGTLGVNWLGSALFGVLLVVGGGLPPWLFAAAGVGLCGALTTFSTALVEAAQWWRADLPARALAYLGATVGGSVGLILLAVKLGHNLP
ncbi:MAG: fluoride efflux transporter FluC [Verrucomicrobiota bacterium]